MSTLLERARAAMPGGVSSPVRAFGAVRGDPPFVASGRGGEITDVDGRTYVDLVGSWGPLILGHAHPAVVEAVCRVARDGLSFGATCEAEVELAERVLARFPFADKVRFVSSGTEAVMSAVRLARGATRRSRVVKFEGCYHGHSDALLVKGGSGLATFGAPSSAGVPRELTALTEVLPLADEPAARELFERRGREIAAVLIEPVPANAGLLLQSREFLALLRELCTRHGALLVFDEVISGFRVAPGGASELFSVEPDIVTLGKILGGGMPVGAYAARAELMDQVAPLGAVYQAGTLSGNPVAMAAGIATLRELERPGTYGRLEALGARLEAGWRAELERAGAAGSVARLGSILWLSLQDGATPRAWHQIEPSAAEMYAELHPELLAQGVWMAPSAYEVAFLSTAHGEEHVDRAARGLGSALGRLGRVRAP
ncbi:MAG TPA: glutamate-1-semialdehyde 2,1-aminomutase [Planctomycetota bacterium]|nr:glutamate-1-semialdehyde 2,1-aminomutase [Planctomycetota bacterium]